MTVVESLETAVLNGASVVFPMSRVVPGNPGHLTLTHNPGMDVAEDGKPVFPEELYGCPPWCTRNATEVNHDSADGMPDWPCFTGYNHTTTLYVEYSAAGDALHPVSVCLALDHGDTEPKISVNNPMDDWADFTLDEAAELADEIKRLVAAYGLPACPSWCEGHHRRNRGDENNHYNLGGLEYGSASRNRAGYANPYAVDLIQAEPQILLADGVHDRVSETTKLTLREARQVAEVITELVDAARGGRPVSAAALETWS